MPRCAQFYAVLGTKISCRASALLTQAQPKEPEGCEPPGVVFWVRRLPGPSLLHSDHSFLFYEEGKRREKGYCRGPPSSAFTPPMCHGCSLFLLLYTMSSVAHACLICT